LEAALDVCPGLAGVCESDLIAMLKMACAGDASARPPVLLRAAAQWIGAGIGQREVRVVTTNFMRDIVLAWFN